jgi:hypothetical protein
MTRVITTAAGTREDHAFFILRPDPADSAPWGFVQFRVD